MKRRRGSRLPYDNLIAFEIDLQMPATRQLFVCLTVKPIN